MEIDGSGLRKLGGSHQWKSVAPVNGNFASKSDVEIVK